MVFDKVYLIKSISAVTNYNSSSCLIHSGIRNIWIDPNKPMRDLSSGNINILDPEEIIDIVFGHPMVKLLMTFFQIISAIS